MGHKLASSIVAGNEKDGRSAVWDRELILVAGDLRDGWGENIDRRVFVLLREDRSNGFALVGTQCSGGDCTRRTGPILSSRVRWSVLWLGHQG
jgi:hypothetical protein